MSTRLQVPAQASARPAIRSAPFGILQRKCACGGSGGSGGECQECKKKKMNLQRHRGEGSEPDRVPPIVHDALCSPGQPLDPATRAFFEPRFGHDFSRVRVHHDAHAAASARAVNALAYTVGRDIVFADAAFAPSSAAGRALLAHELSHVVQQGQEASFAGNPLTLGAADDAYEHEASRAASAALTASAAPRSTPRTSGSLGGAPPAPRAPLGGLHPTTSPYVARVCLNPDICTQYKTPRECLGIPCGYGGSGTCKFPSKDVGCCCLGAQQRRPVPVPVPEKEKQPKMSREAAESKLRELLPAFVVAALTIAMFGALVACFASGVCELAILAGAAAAVALIIIGVLRHEGVEMRGAPPTMA